MPHRLRPAEPADAERLHEIAEAAYAPYVPRIGRRPAPMDDDFGALIADGHVIVCGRPASGYAVSWRDGDVWHLSNVAVMPHLAGLGLGRLLISAVEARAMDEGARAVELYTHVAMTENRAIYLHLGYHPAGERVENGFHRIYFLKPLGDRQIRG